MSIALAWVVQRGDECPHMANARTLTTAPTTWGILRAKNDGNGAARRRMSRKIEGRRSGLSLRLGSLSERGFHRTESQKGQIMKRSVTAIPLLILTAVLFTPGGSATAAPPTPVDGALTFKAGEACPFPIEVALEGKAGAIALPNNPIFSLIEPAPDLRVTVTNLKTGETVTVNATGTFRWVSPTEFVAGGQNFLFGEPQVGATALATTGPIEVQVNANREIVAMDLSGAKVRDICAELA